MFSTRVGIFGGSKVVLTVILENLDFLGSSRQSMKRFSLDIVDANTDRLLLFFCLIGDGAFSSVESD